MEPPIYFLLWLCNRSLEAEATHLELEQELSNRVEPCLTHHDSIASAYLLTAKDQASKHEYQLQTLQTKGFVLEESIRTDQLPFLTRPVEVTRLIVSVADLYSEQLSLRCTVCIDHGSDN